MWDASEYSTNNSMQFRQAMEALRLIDIKGFRRILDIGCGDGAITRYISENGSGAYVLGTDNSASMIDYAQNTHAAPGRLEFRQLSADQLDFEDEFELVCSFSTLHWVKRAWAVWNGFHRATRQKGHVLVGFQADHEHFWDAVNTVAERAPWKKLLEDFDDPYNHFDRDFLIRCIRGSGFHIHRFDEIFGVENFGSRQVLNDFLHSWVPQVRHVPEGHQQKLLDEILDLYFQRVKPELVDNSGIRIKRYIIEALRR